MLRERRDTRTVEKNKSKRRKSERRQDENVANVS